MHVCAGSSTCRMVAVIEGQLAQVQPKSHTLVWDEPGFTTYRHVKEAYDEVTKKLKHDDELPNGTMLRVDGQRCQYQKRHRKLMGANDHDILYDDGSSATVNWKSVKVDTETPTLRPVPRKTQVMAPTQDAKVEVTLWGQALAFMVPSGVPSGELFTVRFTDESYPPGTTMIRAPAHEGTKGSGDWIPVAAGGSYPMESASSAISTPTPTPMPVTAAMAAPAPMPEQMPGKQTVAVAPSEAVDNEASLTCVAKCTVRVTKWLESNVVRELQIGDTVQVLERDMFEGHQRVRIGKNEWASQVTAKGSELLVLSHLLTAESS